MSAYVAGALRESVADVLAEWRVQAEPLSAEDDAWVQKALSKAQLGT